MNRSLLAVIGLAVTLVVVGSFILFTSPAIAQDGTDPTPTPDTQLTPTPTSTISTTGVLPILNAREFIALVAVVLVIAAFLWVILFNYTREIQGKYFETAIKLSKGGISVVPSIIGTSPLIEITGTPTALFIKGPESVVVGQSSEYKATNETGNPQPVKWSVYPANAAAVNPGTDGSSVKVVAATSGAFTLIANVTNDEPKASINIAALAPEIRKVELPAFGWGYGSISIVIVVLAIVLILGLTKSLESAAIATLLGALVGYLFNNRSSAPTTSSTTSSKTEATD